MGVPGAGVRGRRIRRRGEREYPSPEIFASLPRNAAGGTVNPSVTPFLYTSPGVEMASSHSLVAQTQGDTSSGEGSAGGITPFPTALHGTGRDEPGRGRGCNPFPQPVRKHRVEGSAGESSENTGLSYATDVNVVGGEIQPSAYAPRRKR